MTTAKQVYEWVKTGHWNLAQFKEWAQPQQEPVDALDNPRPVGEITWGGCVSWNGSIPEYGTDLYTSPPARKPLTDERLWKIWNSQGDDAMEQQAAINFARAIEAAHGIKDTP